MFTSFATWMLSHSATPEKLAARELSNMRMELFKSEQMVLDAQLRAEYFRKRIEFLELVVARGVDRAADLRISSAPARRAVTPFAVERPSNATAPS